MTFENPLRTSRERLVALGLVALWALLYLPNLRTNPNWYGDEGEWMDASWTLANGHPRVDAVTNDFLFPYPYPPLYLLINGALLRVFGNDIVVGRALGAVIALATAAVLFWIGGRLRDKTFGFLCAASFLVYEQAVINFRWVRGHSLSGLLVLASIGFLVRYVQEKRLRDVVWAGVVCSLAIAATYWAWSLAGAVVITALCVNWKHAPAAAVASGGYLLLFLLGYGLFHDGGFAALGAQLDRLYLLANGANPSPLVKELVDDYRAFVSFLFLMPSLPPQVGTGVDWWPVAAAVGILAFPERRFRKWLALWVVVVAYGVLRRRGTTLPLFMYPSMLFLPLLAIGVAGLIASITEWTRGKLAASWVPATAVLGVFGVPSLMGSFGHFDTKIDYWTQHSVAEAEAAMAFVNAHTTSQDNVIVPKQIYFLVKNARKSMLAFTANYEGTVSDMVPVLVPKQQFWFDCRLHNAKYVVLAYGQDANGQPYGFDAVCMAGLKEILAEMNVIQQEKWPIAFQSSEYKVMANPKLTAPGTERP